MALLKGILAFLMALVAAVTFSQDPQGAYSASGCAGDQPYPQVTKEMKGTKYDCTLTIYNDPTADPDTGDPPPALCGTSGEIYTDMYLFLRVQRGNDYWAFATKVENNCYTEFVGEQTALEEFLRDIVLPGIYEYWDDTTSQPISPSPFCSVWLEDLSGSVCPAFQFPFAMKSVSAVAEDQVSGLPPDPFAWFTDGMYVSVLNFVLAVED